MNFSFLNSHMICITSLCISSWSDWETIIEKTGQIIPSIICHNKSWINPHLQCLWQAKVNSLSQPEINESDAGLLVRTVTVFKKKKKERIVRGMNSINASSILLVFSVLQNLIHFAVWYVFSHILSWNLS